MNKMSGEETDWSYTPLPTLSKKPTPKIYRRLSKRVQFSTLISSRIAV